MIEITLAGHVAVAGEEVRGRRARLALVHMVCGRGRVVTREELAEAVWGEELPATWQVGVREVVAELRALFARAGLVGPDVLAGAAGGYRLLLPPGAVVDVERAREAVGEAERALEAGDPGRAMVLAAGALAVAGAGVLPEESHRSLVEMRAGLHATQIRALEALAAAHVAQRDWAGAAAAAEQLVALEPFRETAHMALMRAQTGAGNRAEALRTFDRLRRQLREELGVAPSPEAEALFLELLGAPASAGAAPRRAPPAAAGPLPALLGDERLLPFAGRPGERDRLRRMWQAAAAGHVRVVVVTGEPGIGKTRLCAEAAGEAVLAGGCVLAARALPTDSAAGVLAAALEPWVQREAPAESLARAAAAGGPALVRLLPGLTARGAPTVAEPVPAAARTRLVGGLALLLGEAARERPVMLVVDEANLEDPLWADLLPRLRAVAPGRGMLVLLAAREGSPLPAGAGHLPLAGLGVEEVEELLVLLGGQRDAMRKHRLAEQIQAETDGNPFHVMAVVRHLADTGALAEASAGWEPRPALRRLSVPDSLQATVADQMARVDPAARAVLETAALAGEVVDLGLLAEVHQGDLATAHAAAEAGVQAGLLRGQAGGAGSARWVHGIVRRAVADGLAAHARRAAHRRLAEALDRPGRAAPIVIARHWAEAAPGHPRTVEAWRRAAEAALDDLAFEAAAAHALTALDHLADDDPAGRARLLALRGRALRHAGEVAAAAGAFVEAGDIARDIGDRALLGEVAEAASAWDITSGEVSTEAFALVEEALAEPQALDLRRRALLVGRRLRYIDPAGLAPGDRAAAAEVLEEARRAGDPPAVAAALQARMVAAAHPADAEERVRYADELVALARALRDPAATAAGLDHRVWGLVELGSLSQAREAMDEYADQAARSGIPQAQAFVLLHELLEATVVGDVARADASVERFREAVRPLIQAWSAEGARTVLGLVQRWLEGRVAELADDVHLLGARLPGLPVTPWTTTWVDAALGQTERPRAVLDALVAAGGLAAMPPGSLWAYAAFQGTDAAVLLRASGPAAALYDQLRGLSGRLCTWHGYCFAGAYDLHLGRLAAVAGRDADAQRHLRAAIGAHDDLGARAWSARAREALADVLVAKGGDGEADALRAVAARELTALGLPTAAALVVP